MGLSNLKWKESRFKTCMCNSKCTHKKKEGEGLNMIVLVRWGTVRFDAVMMGCGGVLGLAFPCDGFGV